MAETLLERLHRKLAEAFDENWPHRSAISAELDPDTRFEAVSGTLTGGVGYRVRNGSGAWQLVHSERMGELHTAADVDDFLAAGLSRFMMKHPEWPR